MKQKKQKNASMDELIEEAHTLIKLFKKHDPKPWPISAKGLDLSAHAGLINQALLEREGFKPSKKAAENLGLELATLFFISLDISREYGIDFETAFREFLKKTKKVLSKQGA